MSSPKAAVRASATVHARCHCTRPTCELWEVVGLQQAVQGLLPAPLPHERVPLWDEVAQGAACAGKLNSACVKHAVDAQSLAASTPPRHGGMGRQRATPAHRWCGSGSTACRSSCSGRSAYSAALPAARLAAAAPGVEQRSNMIVVHMRAASSSPVPPLCCPTPTGKSPWRAPRSSH